jgi:hypothetical protein
MPRFKPPTGEALRWGWLVQHWEGWCSTRRESQVPVSDEAVFTAFVKDGRITAMPAKRSKRLVLLDHVAGLFDIGVHYSEQDVNRVLRTMFDDYVTLRRYLIDEGFLDRAGGEYWRSGGTVDSDGDR